MFSRFLKILATKEHEGTRNKQSKYFVFLRVFSQVIFVFALFCAGCVKENRPQAAAPPFEKRYIEPPAQVKIPASTNALRVCADPNNLPFSNEKREGFENKIAELLGRVGLDLEPDAIFRFRLPDRDHGGTRITRDHRELRSGTRNVEPLGPARRERKAAGDCQR